MYKFNHGIVVFDKKTKDNFIKAWYKLVEETKKEEKPKEEVQDSEDNINNRTIKKKSKRGKE